MSGAVSQHSAAINPYNPPTTINIVSNQEYINSLLLLWST